MTATLGVVLVLGTALRVWRLGATSLNFDESFTAMAGRLPLGALLRYLRTSDSHPPLDYLLRAPLSRTGVSAFVIRLPSAICSTGALAAFAIWTRRFGRAGLLATSLMAFSVFEVQYGREARMYAELQLVGVVALILFSAYLGSPRQSLAVALGAMTLIALFTHVSGLLLAGGLIAAAGSPRARDANRLRAWVAAAVAIWAAAWGPSFVTQSHGNHSSWIPRSTIARAISVVGSLVLSWGFAAAVVVCAAIAFGAVLLRRREPALARAWCACCGVPIVAAIVCGHFAPVLLDRTLTLFASGAFLAVGLAVDRILARHDVVTVIATTALVALTLGRAASSVTAASGPSSQLHTLDALAKPGDVVAIRPPSKGVELDWSLGVRSVHGPTLAAEIDLPSTPALLYTGAPATGHVWLLDFHERARPYRYFARCAGDRIIHGFRVMCLDAHVHALDDVTLTRTDRARGTFSTSRSFASSTMRARSASGVA